MLQEFAAAAQLHVLDAEGWTFQSTLGARRRLDYILASADLDSVAARAVDELCLGSDHRAVKASFLMRAPLRNYRLKQKLRKWKPTLDQQGRAALYADHVTTAMQAAEPNTLEDLERIVPGSPQRNRRATSTAERRQTMGDGESSADES